MAYYSQAPPAVRFSNVNQEIEPVLVPGQYRRDGDREDMSAETQQELRNLSMTMQKSRQTQSARMENFAFEPVSLPPSRAGSPSGSRSHSRRASPGRSHAVPRGHSPPLTPAATDSRDAKLGRAHGSSSNLLHAQNASVLTPQVSPPHAGRHSGPSSRRGSYHQQTSDSTGEGTSYPSSQSGTPGASRHGSSAGHTGPTGDLDDPYARSKRLAQAQNGVVDPRLVFNNSKDARRTSGYGSQNGTAQAATNIVPEHRPQEHRPQEVKQSHSFFGSRKHHDDHDSSPKHSMTDLKRFFKFGGGNKDKHKSSVSTPVADSRRSSKTLIGGTGGTHTPPRAMSTSVPFADDHGLQNKYGKFGKVLGSGAGGSVRLMKRMDGVTFAVKQFRARHNYETEKEYNKKVTAEFCVGSSLHHGNIIETMDIVHERGQWYEVMEYAPYDLFATVMTGKMSRAEVTCSTLQILAGVTYLHSMGLAHRDLKLDNVVVSDRGIMKLIDFGSAVVYRYPFENNVVKATGIVGSDPYLAPEVYDNNKYDPQAVDIWSLAIIFCCMSLRRFPWKLPRATDVSFKLFASPPSPGTPAVESLAVVPEGQDSQQPPYTRSASSDADHLAEATVKGPWRLLRLLPRESRYIIGRMLDLDPKRRATLEEIHADKWAQGASVCRQEPGGEVVRASGHDHVLQHGAGDAGDKPKK